MSPTDHQLLAAIRVARMIDETGNTVIALRNAYRAAATQGEYPADSLAAGEELLRQAGLLIVTGGEAMASPGLRALARARDAIAVSLIRAALNSSDRSDAQTVAGMAGELAVVEKCRHDLVRLGQSSLASQVQQVSLISDWLGYDVSAPTLRGDERQLEVKTMSRPGIVRSFSFYLSRNEYEQGLRHPREWSLVACHRVDNVVAILGWCEARELEPYLPADGDGRWHEASVTIPVTILRAGLPSAV